MSFGMSLDKKKELYGSYLREIGGIKFTFREIDVISCIIHNRGGKKIASLYCKYLHELSERIY